MTGDGSMPPMTGDPDPNGPMAYPLTWTHGIPMPAMPAAGGAPMAPVPPAGTDGSAPIAPVPPAGTDGSVAPAAPVAPAGLDCTFTCGDSGHEACPCAGAGLIEHPGHDHDHQPAMPPMTGDGSMPPMTGDPDPNGPMAYPLTWTHGIPMPAMPAAGGAPMAPVPPAGTDGSAPIAPVPPAGTDGSVAPAAPVAPAGLEGADPAAA